MGVRAIRAKVLCDRATLEALWRTHSVFNLRLQSLIKKLFAMRRGEVGGSKEQRDAYQLAARFLFAQRNASQAAVDLLHAVSIRKKSARTATAKRATIEWSDGTMRDVAGEQVLAEPMRWASQGVFAFDKHVERDGLTLNLDSGSRRPT